MKKEVERCCDVEVKGDKKYRLFVEEAINKFMEYIDCYYKLGFIKSIKVDVSFKLKDKKGEEK